MQSVDMWSVGVIIYVLLAGYPPFHDRDQNRMFRAIKKARFKFHDEYWGEVSAEAKVNLVLLLASIKPRHVVVIVVVVVFVVVVAAAVATTVCLRFC